MISIIVELFFYLRKKPRRDKEISNVEHQFILEDSIDVFIKLSLYKTYGIAIIIIIIILAPFWGEIQANSKINYEVLSIDNQQYIIVVDYLDKAVVQEVSINGNELVIHTDSYTFISKENIVIQNKKYDVVIIEQ